MYLYVNYIFFYFLSTANSFVYRSSTVLLDNAGAPRRSHRYTLHNDNVSEIAPSRSLQPLFASDKSDEENIESLEGVNATESSSVHDVDGHNLPDDSEESLDIAKDISNGVTKGTNSSYDDIDGLMDCISGSTPDSIRDKDGNIKISRKLWKLLTGLLLYREKYGDYLVEPSFIFSEADAPKLKGYCLGLELNSLMETTKLHAADEELYNKVMRQREQSQDEFTRYDIVQAPRLLWLIGFPTTTYLNPDENQDQDNIYVKGIGLRVQPPGNKRSSSSDNDEQVENPETEPERIQQAKKIILDFFKDKYKHQRDKFDSSKLQELPTPSNRVKIRPGLLKGIVANLLEMKQTKSSSVLIKKPVRDDIEGGYHYAFYHWSFEEVIQCMVLFNDMYMDYNRELLIQSEETGTPFNPITFNILKPEWYVPSEECWPEKFHGLPLGLWLDKFRKGDIDAKEHWLRRDILDYLQFDWGDGMDYLSFTWDKLVIGLLWFINMNGHPIMDMPPNLVISDKEIVAKWGKPEEIHGLKLGYLFYSALDHIQVLKKYYPERYEFLMDMGIDYLPSEEIDLGYRPTPHHKLTSISRYARVSKDAEFSVDAVSLFFNPRLSDPKEALRSRLIRYLVNRCLSDGSVKGLTVAISNHKFVTSAHIQVILSTVEDICQLFWIPDRSIHVAIDKQEEASTAPRISKVCDPPNVVAVDICSPFENHLMEFFTPWLCYNNYYKLYNLEAVEDLLVCGVDSGKRFIKWFRSLQAKINKGDTSDAPNRLNLYIIRIEDILSPYFGKSEQRLVALFESAMSNVGTGLTCICIDGIHHFQSDKDNLSDLDRRLLATLLLLLDSVSKSDTILPQSKVGIDKGIKGPLIIVATSDKPPEQLSESLTRPGRLNRTISLSS
ncbi:hypothetical protein BaOVIS_013860 [Babesia ovis]|uniref:ATPase AAA-type core domain-containing protein n=1 Tax=Babesia ovis TaxID=5869 RepID=A0A9W5WV62_BABOV|nr:hypothetical protein BaOVIS_013860 [Babesia ovis]